MAFGDYQNEIYLQGLAGVVPSLPMVFAELEAKAAMALPPSVWSYVAGGAGDERTQRANCEAFERWGLIPRMFVGAAQRDLSVELFGLTLPAPLFMAPIGVIGLCAQDGHGDLATARAAARTGVPMVASTLTVDPLEDVAAALGDTPGFFQLYTPTDRELAASLVQSRRGGRLQGHRRHPRHLGDGLAPARPEHVELPPAARALPEQLLQRPGLPRQPATPAGGGSPRRPRCAGFRSSETR